MKKIIALNGSPRKGWNTDTLVKEACRGAASKRIETEIIQLFDLKYTGCCSCFGCKLAPNTGHCVIHDELQPILKKIEEADGLILGTPNYLSDVTACVRAFMERLIFPRISYKKDPPLYTVKRIPVMLLFTSNCPEEVYDQVGYTQLIKAITAGFERSVGPAKALISGNTWQVNDYDKYDWTMFDVEEKKKQREIQFPKECKMAYDMGAELLM